MAHNSVCLCVSFCPAAAGEKAIVCDQCGAQFQTEESLEAHRQIHTGNTHAHTHTQTSFSEDEMLLMLLLDLDESSLVVIYRLHKCA